MAVRQFLLSDYNQTSRFPPESLGTISTQHVSNYQKTHLLGNLSSNTETRPYRSNSITNSKSITILNSITTDTNIADASMPTPTSIPLDTNILIITVGGVLALLLSILVVQHCLKLRLKRRKYAQQMSLKRNSLKEEDTYQEINVSLMAVGQYNNRNDHQQRGKYYELQTSDQSSAVPYEKIKTELQYQEVNESSALSSTTSSTDSNNSNTSYLVPKKNKRRSYVDVLDTGPENTTTSAEDIHITLNDERSNRDKSESSEYLDPIFDANINENASHSCDVGANSDAYLDVTHETIV